MKKNAISLVNVSKKFSFLSDKPTLSEQVFFFKKAEEHEALKKVSLTVKKGEKLGVVGSNGSGKTTLLKIISGITPPDLGTVKTMGKVVSLIELTAGFHPELSGRENILLNGLLIGMNKLEILDQMESIVNFADIGDFIEAPFYTYSSGMSLRLGFAVASHAKPDIIVMDETWNVGDKDFQDKASVKLNEFADSGKTILLVSHVMNDIKRHSDRVIWLDDGKIRLDGKPGKVIKEYENHYKSFRY